MSLLFNRKGFERVSQEDSDTFLHLEEGGSEGVREWESKEKGVVGSTIPTHSTTSDSQVPLHTYTHIHTCNHVCKQICCQDNSNFKAVYTPSDTATHPLVARSAGVKPFIPQSYNYTDFEINQTKAISQKSTRVTLEVVQQVYNTCAFTCTCTCRCDSTTTSMGCTGTCTCICTCNLVTNHKVLENCRYSPGYVGLTQEETNVTQASSSSREIMLLGPVMNSVVGCLLSHARSICGQEFLLVRGSNPTNDKKILLNRQGVIHELIRDETVRIELDKLLVIYGEFEHEFCSRLTPDATKLPGRIESYLKFALLDIPESTGRRINAYIRESTTLLSINNCIKTAQDLFNVVLLVAIAAVLFEYAISLLFPDMFVSSTKQALSVFVARYIGQTGATISALQSLDNVNAKLGAALCGALVACAKAPDLFGYWRAEMRVKITLQRKMVSVAKCLRCMVQSHSIIKATTKNEMNLSGTLEQFDKLDKFVTSENPKVKKLLQAISSSALDTPARFGLHFGPVIVAWNLLLDNAVRDLVLKAIVAMGEIDAALTLTNRVLHSTPHLPFSLPIIVDSEEAIFDVQGAHFPPVSTLSANKAHACQAINLPPVSILTAENGAGKTTFALAWMSVLLSTQTFGIAACHPSSQVSIFDCIVTSMGVSDSNQESSHESHERYDRELVAKLQNHSGKKIFVLLDELYRGTHEVKGAAKLSALAKRLSVHRKTLKAVFITHFESFALDESIEAVRYTTRKETLWTSEGVHSKASGVLEEGVYNFAAAGFATYGAHNKLV